MGNYSLILLITIAAIIYAVYLISRITIILLQNNKKRENMTEIKFNLTESISDDIPKNEITKNANSTNKEITSSKIKYEYGL